MKISFLIVALLVSYTKIIAQNSFGVTAAYNNTNATEYSDYFKNSSLNRVQLGFYGKRYFLKNWFIKGNIIYNQKGNFYDDTYGIADAGKSVSIRLNYVETALNAGYTIIIKEQQHIHLGVGPYMGYGINGTEKGYAVSIFGAVKINKKIDFVNSQTKEGSNQKIKPLDFGINFNLEYQYKRYGVFINYGLGLANRENFGKSFNKVTSVGLSYSYNLIRQRKKKGKGCFTE